MVLSSATTGRPASSAALTDGTTCKTASLDLRSRFQRTLSPHRSTRGIQSSRASPGAIVAMIGVVSRGTCTREHQACERGRGRLDHNHRSGRGSPRESLSRAVRAALSTSKAVESIRDQSWLCSECFFWWRWLGRSCGVVGGGAPQGGEVSHFFHSKRSHAVRNSLYSRWNACRGQRGSGPGLCTFGAGTLGEATRQAGWRGS
jgi:hypothetical protein